MNEPVAYMIRKVGETLFLEDKPSWASDSQSIPLYTAEHLRPRVKMTQAEFDEFVDLASYSKLIGVITHLYEDNRSKYPLLFKRFSGDGDTIKLAQLWSDYEREYPEETIEIVPNMKWFVRSKEPSNDGSYLFRSGIKDFGDYYYTKDKNENKIAYPFDTKEEAEKWTNPLTEAVQLPVEGE